MKRIVYTDRAPSPVGPYSQAVKAGDFLFISGQIALESQSGKLVTEDIEKETHLVMKNLQSVLKAANMDFDNVVKCSIFVRDINQYALINEVYSEYFRGSQPPARELVEVTRLPKDANVEISAIAI